MQVWPKGIGAIKLFVLSRSVDGSDGLRDDITGSRNDGMGVGP